MKQLPDLPFLESVEISLPHWPAYAAIFIVVAFISPLISLFRRCYPMESNLLFGFIFGFVVSGGLIVWILYRLLCSTYYWKTDTSGLTTCSLTKRKFTRWQDMEASPRVPDADSHSPRIEIIEASIFQHLRRHGKQHLLPIKEQALSLWDTIPDDLPADLEWENPRRVQRTILYATTVCIILRRHGKQHLLPIKEQALSLWDTIPDDLPADLEWENPRRVQRTILYATTVCIILVTLGLGFTTITILQERHSDTAFLAVMTIVYAFVIWFGIVHQNRLQPIRASLRGGVLEIQTVSRSISLKASDVSSAWWGEPGMLHLKTVDKVHLLIPLDSIYDKSSMMVLGIIRWLRTADNPIAISIPDILRSTNNYNIQTTDTDTVLAMDCVDVRISTGEKLGLMGMGLMITIPMVSLILEKQPTRSIVITDFIIATIICALIWWATGIVAISANSEGVIKTSLWRKQLVRWTDIADFTFGFRAGSGIQYQSLRYILWASDGRPLLSIYRLWGSKNDWERFFFVFHIGLAKVLPKVSLDKPWKSRQSTEDRRGALLCSVTS